MAKFKTQFVESDNIVCDCECHDYSQSRVVNGQALTGSELFRRMSAGLPVGCALRSFNEVNPFIEKFSIYDSIGQFRIRHGLVDRSELDDVPPSVSDTVPPSEPSQEQ